MVNIFSPAITPRLRYVLGVIFRDHLRVPYQLNADKNSWLTGEGPKIHYCDESLPGSLQIRPSGYLEDKNQKEKAPQNSPLKDVIPLEKSQNPWPFDLFGAIFYLLSRHEEYLNGALFDHMGRFDPEGSWANRHGWLEIPLIDQWIQALALGLDIKTGREFTFSPTYDIDQPWCYQHKGMGMSILNGGKSLLTGHWGRIREQGQVLQKKKKDPFDNFGWLDDIHTQQVNGKSKQNAASTETPVYFFPVSRERTRFDKNPLPGNEAYQALIHEHSQKYPVGIHPSFYSTSIKGKIKEEVDVLREITGLPVTISRFHYIHFRLPGAYRLLLEAGIRADYSMGYGEKNGFRASYSRPFKWYDLEKEEETSLTIVPYCWMEATAFYNEKLSKEEALANLKAYATNLRKVGGRLTTIWHNSSLNDARRWIGWREVYQDFLNDIAPPLPS